MGVDSVAPVHGTILIDIHKYKVETSRGLNFVVSILNKFTWLSGKAATLLHDDKTRKEKRHKDAIINLKKNATIRRCHEMNKLTDYFKRRNYDRAMIFNTAHKQTNEETLFVVIW